MDTELQKERIMELINEIIDDVSREMLNELRNMLNAANPQLKDVAEELSSKLRKALSGHVPEQRLNELLDKLPDDLTYFIEAGMRRAVRKMAKMLYYSIEEKVDMKLHNFLEIPEVLMSLPEKVKKALAEWWEWYDERFNLPTGAFLDRGKTRICVTYNMAKLNVICLEGCLAHEETNCKKECRDYLRSANHVAEHAIRHLQEVLEDHGIEYNTADFVLGRTKYMCVDVI